MRGCQSFFSAPRAVPGVLPIHSMWPGETFHLWPSARTGSMLAWSPQSSSNPTQIPCGSSRQEAFTCSKSELIASSAGPLLVLRLISVGRPPFQLVVGRCRVTVVERQPQERSLLQHTHISTFFASD